MASNGFRPALLFLSSSGVSTTASISARKLSHGTRRSMASSGSPLADKASKRLSASKNPSCPIVASANQNLTHQIRTGRENQLFFEVPNKQDAAWCHDHGYANYATKDGFCVGTDGKLIKVGL